VIRNVVIHLMSEQPLIADLFEMPSTADVTLRLTNLRTLDGKRPVFVDRSESVFFFPYLHVRFIELPPAAVGQAPTPAATRDLAALPAPASASPGRPDDPDQEIEIDEDFLRRVREA
jgi:hypothetical protein